MLRAKTTSRRPQRLEGNRAAGSFKATAHSATLNQSAIRDPRSEIRNPQSEARQRRASTHTIY
jgi:hypothetical protein